MERSNANLMDLLHDHGVRPGSNVCCEISNFAVVVTTWFACWRLGANLMTAQSAGMYRVAGITPEFSLVPVGAKATSPGIIELSPEALTDEVGDVPEGSGGITYFHTVNSSRHPRVIGVTCDQLLLDAQNYSQLLGPPKGAVFLTTGLGSLRAIRDVLRAFMAGQAVAGPDVSVAQMWVNAKSWNIRELLLSP